MAKGEVRYRLVLDSKAFVDGLKAAKNEANQMADAMAGKLGKAGNVLSAMGPAGFAAAAGIGAMAAAGATALKVTFDAASAAMKYADAMAVLQDKTGLSSKALQDLELAAKLGNSSLDAVAGAVNKMQKGLVENSQAFTNLGLSLSNLKKMSPEGQFRAVAKAVESISDPATKAAYRIAIFGKSGNDLAGVLKAAAEGAIDLGGALSDDALKAAADLQDQADLLGSAMERVKLQFGASVAQSHEVQQAFRDLTSLVADFAVALGKAAPKISDFFNMMVSGARAARAGMSGGIGAFAASFFNDASEAAMREQIAKWKNEVGFGTAAAGFGPKKPKPPPPPNLKPGKGPDKLKTGGFFGALFSTPQMLLPNFGVDNLGAPGIKGLTSDMKRDFLGGSSPVLAIQAARKATIDWRASLMDVSNAFSSLQGKAAQGLGAIAGGIATIGQMQKQLATSVDAGGLKGAGGIGGLLGKVGAGLGIAGAAISIGGAVIGGIKSLFGGKSKEEKAAEEAAKQQKIKETISKLEDLMAKAKQLKMDQLTAGVGGLAGMFAHLADQTDVTGERFRRLEFFGAALFKKLKEEGLSSAEAFEVMGPALDQAIEAAKANGQELQGVLGQLAAFRELVQANEGLVGAVSGFNDLVTAVGVTRETFAHIQPEMQAFFDEMISKGFSADQAVGELAPTLFAIREAARQGRIEVDAGTQALIAQAEAGGHFDNLKDPMTELVEVQKMMLELWGAIAQMQGVTLPESLRKYLDEIRNVGNAVGSLPVTGGPGGGHHTPSFQNEYDGEDVIHAAGGFYSSSMPHGPLPGGGTPMVVHPGEGVNVQPGGFHGGMGLGPIVLQVDGREIARVNVAQLRKNGAGLRSQSQRYVR